MNHKTIALLVAAAGLLLGVACSDGDGDDLAQVETQSPNTDGDATTTSGEDQSSTTETTDGGGGGGSPDEAGSSSGDLPLDQDLDTELRHPRGLTVRVSRLSFDEGAVYVDAEMVNGSNEDGVTLYGGSAHRQLRIVDDAGVEYPYVPADEAEGDVVLAPGETVSGRFAFRGPLSGRPDRLYLVTNMSNEDIASFDINEDNDRYYPGFVVPFDLEWG